MRGSSHRVSLAKPGHEVYSVTASADARWYCQIKQGVHNGKIYILRYFE